MPDPNGEQGRVVLVRAIGEKEPTYTGDWFLPVGDPESFRNYRHDSFRYEVKTFVPESDQQAERGLREALDRRIETEKAVRDEHPDLAARERARGRVEAFKEVLDLASTPPERCPKCKSRDPKAQICEWCGEELTWPAKDGFCTDGVGRVGPCPDPFHTPPESEQRPTPEVRHLRRLQAAGLRKKGGGGESEQEEPSTGA